jgi:hypothetical protein
MKEMMASLDKDTVVRAFKRFMSRIDVLVEADGDFIK